METKNFAENVRVTKLGGMDVNDIPDMVDAYAEEAMWNDTAEFLTDEELDELNFKHSEVVQEAALLNICGG